MNTIKINSASLNRVGLNVIGEIRSSANDGPISYPNGVYIQHIDSKLYTADEWTAKGYANEDANGVAVIADEAKFVIAKNDLGQMAWSSNTSSLVKGILATTDSATAITDFAGYDNTQLMLATDTSGAGYSCANYTFPNGKKGYLPALGELDVVSANKLEIDALMTKIGGTTLQYMNYWSSTQYRFNKSWTHVWSWGKGTLDKSRTDGYVRVFSVL